ncbi:MAG: 50S ribosomal protein L21 [Candidatus Eisenbacteria bacterium]|uniref:Large ribosomal subunit protein bL21 n=1 Tax=Eiseniibacteriota bacterium TaxID=2212470 RepID=A0A538U0B6_UNCEI|nr:MAG: 50S ribosomal protein L21 [Candidatus Eisenbacteria bacterium]
MRPSPQSLELQGEDLIYAIVNINGIQTRVAPDEVLSVARTSGAPGDMLTFDQVLMVADGEKIAIGQPYLKGAVLTAELVEHLRGPKLRIFKFKRRREYRRRRGYRDELTRIRVSAIKV